jgi:hypothetical protein
MPSIAYNVAVPSGKTPALILNYQAQARKQSYQLPLTGTIFEVFYQAPGLPEQLITSVDMTELKPRWPAPPLQTPPGNQWIDGEYYFTLPQRTLQPIDMTKKGLNVVRVAGKWYLSSETHHWSSQSGPGFTESAFDTRASCAWFTLEDDANIWPPAGAPAPIGLVDSDIQDPGDSVFPLPPFDTAADFEFVFQLIIT